ncbi:MAG TPA: PadR family transcriptional regulator [Candidatus Bathyarchaeia archaeon]|nr:PadR family transcriptional regulator [Candidatus Bathyarchaeia archaeon]
MSLLISILISEVISILFPFRHWMRHMAMVPKGFLRYQVLKLLDEKPMSGSELMAEIEKQTEGRWRPSPGSIYPLLSWLQDKGYIKEADGQEAGVKRYALSDSGKALLVEHGKRQVEMRKRFPHFGPGPGFMGPMWFEFYPERAKELRRATKDLAMAIWKLRDKIREEYSEKAVQDAAKALEETAKKIEEIAGKLRGE